MAGADVRPCVFCQIAQSSTSTTLLYRDDRIVVFQDINPRHYLSVPINHIATVNDLRRTTEDYELVKHMLKVGQNLLSQDAPQSTLHRYIWFPYPPFNSVDHLHLHCLALPFIPSWRWIKYTSLGPLPGFIEVEEFLERIKP
ncbi:unnamed protein product [Spirodela intermedia]|uniref:HIT domain-containing protein n=1 Tax=Spirodela intermedia TaxID=51605 RepID=A0A7I8IEM7_SPIIN|nr:unnamed protein product [Spirodela intermedia]CAA6656139.1 unnamed protein product [Spirodela intermedia]